MIARRRWMVRCCYGSGREGHAEVTACVRDSSDGGAALVGGPEAGARTECSGEARGAGGGCCCRGAARCCLPPFRQSAARHRHECCESRATYASSAARRYVPTHPACRSPELSIEAANLPVISAPSVARSEIANRLSLTCGLAAAMILRIYQTWIPEYSPTGHRFCGVYQCYIIYYSPAWGEVSGRSRRCAPYRVGRRVAAAGAGDTRALGLGPALSLLCSCVVPSTYLVNIQTTYLSLYCRRIII